MSYDVLVLVDSLINVVSYNKDTAAVDSDPLADLQPSAPLPILMRATNGKSKDHRKNKMKLSTVVEPASLEVFYARYAEVCRSGMQGLKKRDRSGRKKGKAKKKKGGAEAEKKI